VEAAMSSPDPESSFAILEGKISKDKGKTGSKDAVANPMDEYDKLLGMIGKLEEMGDMERAEGLRKRLDAIDFDAAKKPAINPSTGAVIPQGDFDAAAEQAKLDAARAGDTSLQPTATPRTFIPASEFERQSEQARVEAAKKAEALKKEAQFTANEKWDAAKAKLTETFNNGNPQELLNIAKSAVLGDAVDNDAARMVAGFAAAFADGREVTIGERDIKDASPAERIEIARTTGQATKMPIKASPEMAFLQALGVQPDAIIGYAPSRVGGKDHPITALEAAKARLAEIADPLLQRRKQQQTTDRKNANDAATAKLDSSEDAIIQAALKKGTTGIAKTN